jgi:GAF domain-containing protein
VRWLPAPLPHDEKARLDAVKGLGLLDTPPSDAFDRLTRLAAGAANVPIAGISLIDADRQWFKSTVGLVRQDIPRDLSLCVHAILSEQGLVVPDLLIDERFADRPPQLAVRFYVGLPLHDASRRHRVGTLCVMGYRPRTLGSEQRRALEDLARLAEQLLWSTPREGQGAEQETA